MSASPVPSRRSVQSDGRNRERRRPTSSERESDRSYWRNEKRSSRDDSRSRYEERDAASQYYYDRESRQGYYRDEGYRRRRADDRDFASSSRESFRYHDGRDSSYRYGPADNGWQRGEPSQSKDRRRREKHDDEAEDYYRSRRADLDREAMPRAAQATRSSRDERSAPSRQIRDLERTPEHEDAVSRERRIRRLKRRRRSAGLDSSSSEADDYREARRDRTSRAENSVRTAYDRRPEDEADPRLVRRERPASELERRLSARDDHNGHRKQNGKSHINQDSRGDRTRRRSFSPDDRRMRHERSSQEPFDRPRQELDSSDSRYTKPKSSRGTSRERHRTGARKADDEGFSGEDTGLRIAGSSARRRNDNGNGKTRLSDRSRSPEVKLLRRRRSTSPKADSNGRDLASAEHLAEDARKTQPILGGRDSDSHKVVTSDTGDALRDVTPESKAPSDVKSQRGRPDEKYERIAQVGEGTYGQVFKARSDRTGVIVALKRIRMESERDGFPITAMREIKLLQGLRHENIVMLHEIMLSKNSIYMVFEYLEHDLNGVLSQDEIAFSHANLKSLAQQLLAGLAYLHQHSILHRDLKCSNLLLNNDGTLKLADFGLARLYTKQARAPKQKMLDYTNRVVTLWYRAPELLFGETSYSDAIDVWGAGCIFLELFVRKPVFPGNDEIHQVQLLFDSLGPITSDAWPEAENTPWYDLVRPAAGASKGTADRASLRSLFANQLPDDAIDVAEALLTYSPHRRVSARNALTLPYFVQNSPMAQKPAHLLQAVQGEWHEFESRRAKRDAAAQALHAHVHRERAVEKGQRGQANEQGATQPTPDIPKSGRTDPTQADEVDEGNASA